MKTIFNNTKISRYRIIPIVGCVSAHGRKKKCNDMNKIKLIHAFLLVALGAGFILSGCTKQTSGPVFPVASLNAVNALPNSAPLVLVQGSISSVIGDFLNIDPLPYASTSVLTPRSGSEPLYAIQQNEDTTSVSAKGGNFIDRKSVV